MGFLLRMASEHCWQVDETISEGRIDDQQYNQEEQCKFGPKLHMLLKGKIDRLLPFLLLPPEACCGSLSTAACLSTVANHGLSFSVDEMASLRSSYGVRL